MERAGLVLIVPTDFAIQDREADLEAVIQACKDLHLAAIRLATAGLKRDVLTKRGDLLREIAHRHEIAVLADDLPSLVLELGLDGVHLTRPELKTLRETRKQLGKDAIIGVHAGNSKHDGMSLGEIGVDYVAFGPLKDRGLDEPIADQEIFEWWAEMIELPLVAEGAIDAQNLEPIKGYVDFIALSDEVFSAPNPVAALNALIAIL